MLARLSFKGRLQHESAMLAETRAELARTRTEAETLAMRLSALDGGSAAREAALTKQLEAERERRVEGLKAVAIRRMVLKELARGWSGWFAMYEAQVHQRNLLKKAGARLTKPQMSACYHHWRRSWEEIEAASLRRGALAAELRAVELGTSHGTLAAECERLRAELAAAREAMLRGEGYEAERERRQEEREARTRERRVEHLSALAARRMGRKELAMGWQAWSELYREKVHQRTVLRQAAMRLQRPKFVWSYVRWRETWRLALLEESKLMIREQLGTERKRRADAEAAITELHSEYGVKMRELGVTVGEAREAALEYLRQLKLATRDDAEWADKFELLQAKWAEMTDEDRIGREARRLLEAQQKTEYEATEARLGRLLAEQRSQLLCEAVAMRGDLEKQLHELQLALRRRAPCPHPSRRLHPTRLCSRRPHLRKLHPRTTSRRRCGPATTILPRRTRTAPTTSAGNDEGALYGETLDGLVVELHSRHATPPLANAQRVADEPGCLRSIVCSWMLNTAPRTPEMIWQLQVMSDLIGLCLHTRITLPFELAVTV
jgi:hypothetical protein